MRGKRRLFLSVLVAAAFAASGCAQTELAVYTVKKLSRPAPKKVTAPSAVAAVPPFQRPAYKIGKPYQIDGVWYTPKEDANYDATGIASWYGLPFDGRPTANGETYDMNALTAAHKTLPMPTMVRVTNLENGRSLVLRVNDRGPFVNGRVVDVSRRAAQLLGFLHQGTAKVRIAAVQSPARRFVSNKPITTEEERYDAAAAPQAAVASERLPPPEGVPAAPARPSSRPPSVTLIPVTETRMYVQAGAFTRQDNAERLSAGLSPLGPARMMTATVKGQRFFRVRIGPLTSVEKADAMLTRVINGGYRDARIVID